MKTGFESLTGQLKVSGGRCDNADCLGRTQHRLRRGKNRDIVLFRDFLSSLGISVIEACKFDLTGFLKLRIDTGMMLP